MTKKAKKTKRPTRARGVSRDAIVDVAARLFREHGLDGVGVDEIMRGAGLTHGGFYSHFANKTALIEAALDRGFAQNRRFMLVEQDPLKPPRAPLQGDAWFAAVRDRYVSRSHVAEPAAGCLIPALAAEVGRSGPSVRAAFTRAFQKTLGSFSDKLTDERTSPDAARAEMLAALTRWVGAIVLARAVDDDALVDEILASAKKADRR